MFSYFLLFHVSSDTLESASGSGTSGSGVSRGGSASGLDQPLIAGSGSSRYDNTSTAGSGSEGMSNQEFTVSALLSVSSQEGGIQCPDAGQYLCVAGIGRQAEAVRNISIKISIKGKLTV